MQPHNRAHLAKRQAGLQEGRLLTPTLIGHSHY